ncbi:uncharacterized protein LOC117104861 [Anneissia japonica]|uniref:uncharacterized protein LOC117104861 n=1 Tax=Anneissia japonica TaxID=1529436 RepID=UPI0014257AF2|nr:uncharacterized protein LOC117104861 [Anneissia japonica]
MLGMTEWNVQTSQITGSDTEENSHLKCIKQEMSGMKSSNMNGAGTNKADGLRERLSRRHTMDNLGDQLCPSTRAFQRMQPTDSNLTLDSDLSSEPQNSRTLWNLNSSVENDKEYIMNQKLIDVEASNRATRRSGVTNFTSGLADIKESSFDSDVEKMPRSTPPPSPKSPIIRRSSDGFFKQVSTEVHAKLKRSKSSQGISTYAARRKALTRTIQEWVNSIDRSPHPEEDDNEALSFLPVGDSPKQANTSSSEESNDFDGKQAVLPKQSTSSQLEQESSSGHITGHQSRVTGESESCSPGEELKPLASKPTTSKPTSQQQVNNFSKPVDTQFSNSDLIMMASHYRQEHGQSPITRRQRLLHMGVSQSSEMSTSSTWSQSSCLDEILKNRNDPEEVLLDLGFGTGEQELIDRVPTRFYSKPSKARGMNIGQFLTNCHEQEIRSYDDLNIGGGFRSIVGILQRSREGQAREQKMAQRMRKRSVVNAWNKWLNRTKVTEGQKNDVDSNNVAADMSVDKNVDQKETELQDIQIGALDLGQIGSNKVVEDIITSSSVQALHQEPELIVDDSEKESVSQQEKVSDYMDLEKQSKVKDGQHCVLPLPSAMEDSEGSVASKKSSCSTIEGDSVGSTVINRRDVWSSYDKPEESSSQDVFKDSLVQDHSVDNLVDIRSVKDTKDHLRRLPGHFFSNTPQESFEFEEVSTASEMMEDEKQAVERASAMKGQLSRAGSAQSDSSGFADDLVEIPVMSLLPPVLDDNDDEIVYVDDKVVQTNFEDFPSKEERRSNLIVREKYDSFIEDSPFDDNCPEITPQPRGRSGTFPRPSEKAPWSADHPRSVVEILKTLKDNSEVDALTSKEQSHIENSASVPPKRPPLLKLKSVFSDYPEDCPTQLAFKDSTFKPSNSSQLPSIDSTDQQSNSNMPSIDPNFQECNSSHLPSIDTSVQQCNSSNLPSIDTSVEQSNSSHLPSIDTFIQESNILPENAQLEYSNFECHTLDSSTTLSPSLSELDSTGMATPVIFAEDDYTNEPCGEPCDQTSLTNVSDDLQETKTNVTSTLEVYFRDDHCGNVIPSNETPNLELTYSDSEHKKVCCDLSDWIGSVKSGDIRPPINEMEFSNAKQQMAFQDILLLHRAISSYKFELVELEGLSDKIYQMVHSHLTLSERFELSSLKRLRLQVMDEVESIESLLVRLAHTISNHYEVEDFSGTYRNALDHLQVLKQMINLLQEQKMLRELLGSLEVEYRIAYGSVVDEHPMPWTAERALLIEQLMDLKAGLDRQHQSSQTQFASSLQEMKHDLLEQLRNDVLEETESLRSQLKLKETEVENLKRQLQTGCDGNINQSNISSHVT